MNNVIVSDPIVQANHFANHYALPVIDEFIPFDLSDDENSQQIFLFTFEELQKILNEMSNTAPGLDGISARFIKYLLESYKRQVLGLFNKFWISGDVPEEWAISKILPIVKPGKYPRQLQSY
ncbi:hypothetical protein AVEN_206715-1 [Araneus ventricosus]|uniref:Reverse transcriptase domain-containing protein n=1 Tax=Araneus ventricosus TaxID=182803 RepID=A0A4Y2QCE4_ARAVE|nr:hypothetical protein AVEN_206715-1 [Araneus ventricosus]